MGGTVQTERADFLAFVRSAADTGRELSISELPGAPEGFTRVGIGCAYTTTQMMEEALSLPAGTISEIDMPAPNTEGQNSLIWLDGDTVLESWVLASPDLDLCPHSQGRSELKPDDKITVSWDKTEKNWVKVTYSQE